MLQAAVAWLVKVTSQQDWEPVTFMQKQSTKRLFKPQESCQQKGWVKLQGRGTVGEANRVEPDRETVPGVDEDTDIDTDIFCNSSSNVVVKHLWQQYATKAEYLKL